MNIYVQIFSCIASSKARLPCSLLDNHPSYFPMKTWLDELNVHLATQWAHLCCLNVFRKYQLFF